MLEVSYHSTIKFKNFDYRGSVFEKMMTAS